MSVEHIAAPLEVKFAEAGADPAGTFSGMASVFGVVDSHGDSVVPGAFAASLAEHKARGSLPIMYAMHGPALGADPLPSGVWQEMRETPEGLHVKGRISALDTDYGKRIRGLIADGALGSLSIGFRVRPGGAAHNAKALPGEAHRTLKSVSLIEVSLVPTGSNPQAKVQHIKSEALDAIAEFKARLTAGEVPEVREFERLARDALGLTRTQAAILATRGYKALCTRDAAEGEARKAAARAAQEMHAALDGFSLPRF
jgi:HK97 family phage prohead protease